MELDRAWFVEGVLAPSHGNACVPLVDGDEYFAALRLACRGATRLLVAVSFGNATFLHNLLKDCRVKECLVLAWHPHEGNPLFSGGMLTQDVDLPGVSTRWCHSAPDKHHCHHEKTFVVEHEGGTYTAITGGIIPALGWVRKPGSLHPDMHDVGILVRGRAAFDVALCFAQRWNLAGGPPQLELAAPTFLGTSGPCTCQITRSLRPGYVNAKGEASIFAMYRKAIRLARELIYIEQQHAVHEELLEELKAALNRGVKVIYVRPGLEAARSTSQERCSVDLSLLGRTRASYERVFLQLMPQMERSEFAFMGMQGVHVHSKFIIVDDEFTCVGSANLVDISMDLSQELHSEICIGVHDRAFATQFRRKLFDEHCGGVPSDYSFGAFVMASEERRGTLFRMSPTEWGKRILPYAVRIYEQARGEMKKG